MSVPKDELQAELEEAYRRFEAADAAGDTEAAREFKTYAMEIEGRIGMAAPEPPPSEFADTTESVPVAVEPRRPSPGAGRTSIQSPKISGGEIATTAISTMLGFSLGGIAAGKMIGRKLYRQMTMVEPEVEGNIDLTNRPTVRNTDGTISTVRSITVGTDKGAALIPTISDDGRVMSNEEAIQQFNTTGRHLGIFKSESDADRYAFKLSKEQAEMYGGRKPGAGYGDYANALAVGGTMIVANYLSGRERELQMRETTKRMVYDSLPSSWQDTITGGGSIEEMTFPEFDAKAQRLYGRDYAAKLTEISADNPAAQQLISDAKSYGNVGVYENLIRPYFSKNGPDLAENWQETLNKTIDQYSEDARISRDKPFLAAGAEFFKPGTWFDGTTKAPWHDWDGFVLTTIEQAPMLLATILAARTGGRVGGEMALSKLSSVERATPALARKLINRGSAAGGAVAGGATEGILIRDSVSQQTYDSLMALDDETWKTSEDYHRLRDAGLTDTDAKEVIASEISRSAGNVAMVVSGFMMGAPAGAVFGQMAGGQTSRSLLLNFAKGWAVETGQEVPQEAVEQIIGNLGVRRVDPNQPIFSGVGEAMMGAAMMVGPIGGIGGVLSTPSKGPGVTADQQKVLDAFKPFEKAANARWKLQNQISDKDWGKDKTPEERLNAMVRWENLRVMEADAFLKAEPLMRRQLTNAGAPAEHLVRLQQLRKSAETAKAQIAEAQRTRATAAKQAEQMRQQMMEREEISAAIEADVLKLSDVERMADNITKVRRLEAVEPAGYEELIAQGYGRWNTKGDKFIITPKGARAVIELEQQAQLLAGRIESGYVGKERRKNLELRDRYAQMTPEQLDEAIRVDPVTKVLNRRAFEDDEKEAPARAYAEVDADSLKWVNDNMGTQAGDDFMGRIAEALRSMEGVTVYRTGGDEFTVTGESQEQLETALQGVKRNLRGGAPVVSGGESVLPQVTWATGNTRDEAAKSVKIRKVEREAAGKRAPRDIKPSSHRVLSQEAMDFEVGDEGDQSLMMHRERPTGGTFWESNDPLIVAFKDELRDIPGVSLAEKFSNLDPASFRELPSGKKYSTKVSRLKAIAYRKLPANVSRHIGARAGKAGSDLPVAVEDSTLAWFANDIAKYTGRNADEILARLKKARAEAKRDPIRTESGKSELGNFGILLDEILAPIKGKSVPETAKNLGLGYTMLRNLLSEDHYPSDWTLDRLAGGISKSTGRSFTEVRQQLTEARDAAFLGESREWLGSRASLRQDNEFNKALLEAVSGIEAVNSIGGLSRALEYSQSHLHGWLVRGKTPRPETITRLAMRIAGLKKLSNAEKDLLHHRLTVAAAKDMNAKEAVSYDLLTHKDEVKADKKAVEESISDQRELDLHERYFTYPTWPGVKWSEPQWPESNRSASKLPEPMGPVFAINDRIVDILDTKKLVGIWCHADQFFESGSLAGFSTGMFVSELSEAEWMKVDGATQGDVDESNRIFAEAVGKVIGQDADSMYDSIIAEYGALADRNPVARYNLSEMKLARGIHEENSKRNVPNRATGEKTLVIHPKDESTDFLKPLYAGHPDWTVVSGGMTIGGLRELIKSHDRIVMLGHGSPAGLFAVKQFEFDPIVQDVKKAEAAAPSKGLDIKAIENDPAAARQALEQLWAEKGSQVSESEAVHKVEILERGYHEAAVDSDYSLLVPSEFVEVIDDAVGGIDRVGLVLNSAGKPALRQKVAVKIYKAAVRETGIENPSQIGVALRKAGHPAVARATIMAMLSGDATTVSVATMNRLLAGMRLFEAGEQVGRAAMESPVTMVTPSEVTESFATGARPAVKREEFFAEAREQFKPLKVRATRSQMRRIQAAIRSVIGSYKNLPSITIVNSVEEIPYNLKRQMGNHNPFAIRGMFDEQNPENGVVIVAANIVDVMYTRHGQGMTMAHLERAAIETAFHEIVGHYGLRGLTGSQSELDEVTAKILRSFPKEAEAVAAKTGYNRAIPEQAKLLGEEVFAYMAGEELAKRITMPPQQRNVFEKAIAKVKEILTRLGFGRFMKMSRKDILDLIAASQRFARSGPEWQFKTAEGRTLLPYMRDAEMFQTGMIKAVLEAVRPLTGEERKQLALKDPAMKDVREVPAFPVTGSVNDYVNAVEYAESKLPYVSKTEMEMSGIKEAIKPSAIEAMLKMSGRDTAWLAQKLGMTEAEVEKLKIAKLIPDKIAASLSDIAIAEANAKAAKVKTKGGSKVDFASLWPPIMFVRNNALRYQDVIDTFMDGDWKDFPKWISILPAKLRTEYEQLIAVGDTASVARMQEILALPVNMRETTLSRDMILNYLQHPSSYKIIPQPLQPQLRSSDPQGILKTAFKRVLGRKTWDSAVYSALSPEKLQAIEDEVTAIEKLGYDYGYDEKLKRWFDESGATGVQTQQYSPTGYISTPKENTFRVVLVYLDTGKDVDRKGRPFPRHGHFSYSYGRRGIGALFHLRYGDVWDGDENPPTAPNPEKQGRTLHLGELQTDWFTQMGYPSAGAESLAKAKSDRLGQTLTDAAMNYIQNVSADLLAAFDAKMQSVVTDDLRKLSVTEAEREVATWSAGELRNFLSQNGIAPSTGNASAKANAVKLVADTAILRYQLASVQPWLKTAAEAIDIIRDHLYTAASTSRRINEATAFENLDQQAVVHIVTALSTAISQMATGPSSQAFSNLSRLTPSEANSLLDYMRSSMLEVSNDYEIQQNLSSSRKVNVSENKLLRLPHATATLRTAISPIYDLLGADKGIHESRLEGLGKNYRKSVIVVPESLLTDIDYGGAADTREYLRNAFKVAGQFSADLSPNFYNVSAEPGGMVGISVTAPANMMAFAKSAIPDIISYYTEKEAKPGWQIRKQQLLADHARKARESQLAAERQWKTDLPDNVDNWLEWQGIDTPTPAQYAEWSLESEQEYITRQRPTWLAHIRGRRSRYIDWWEADVEGGSLNESSDQYRALVITDANGDENTDAADRWLTAARNAYVDRELLPGGTLYARAEAEARNEYRSDPPSISVGRVPLQWSDSGDVTSSLKIVRTYDGIPNNYRVYLIGVNGYREKISQTSGLGASQSDTSSALQKYFADNRLDVRAAKAPWESPPAFTTPTEPAIRDPNFDAAKAAITNALGAGSTEVLIDLPKAFEEMVVHWKMQNGANLPETPLSKDDVWRTLALRYLLADAVRRGYAAITWDPGEASSKRGLMGQPWTATERIKWSVEKLNIRGVEKEFYVVTSNEFSKPVIVDPIRAFVILGKDVADLIEQQRAGKIKRFMSGPDPGTLDESAFLISKVGSKYVVQRAGDPAILGIADTEAEILQKRDDLLNKARSQSAAAAAAATSSSGGIFPQVDNPFLPKLGVNVVDAGEVTAEMIGGTINVLLKSKSGYQPTDFEQPGASSTVWKMMGARQNYDHILHKVWSKELAKYGASITIGSKKISASEVREVVQYEGAHLAGGIYPPAFIAKWGEPRVEELRGQNYGFVIVAANGLVDNIVYGDRNTAEDAMRNWAQQEMASMQAERSVKVYKIVINDKIRDAFAGPVVPYHYDPYTDPVIKSAASKIGSKTPSLWERYQDWRRSWKDAFLQGMFDRFHGIEAALEEAQADRTPYIMARLTTSLDSMMKAAMEYGHPVWKDGIVQSEGRGLIDILEPVGKNIELWAMYMAGVRSKRLLLEGMDALSTDDLAALEVHVRNYSGSTFQDRVMSWLAGKPPGKPSKGMTRREFMVALGMSAASAMMPNIGGSNWPKITPEEAEKMAKDYFGPVMQTLKYNRFKPLTDAQLQPIIQRVFEQTDPAKARQIATAVEGHLRYRAEWISEIMSKRADKEANAASEATLKKIKEAILGGGRERLFEPAEIEGMVRLGDAYPIFKTVAADYAEYNSKVLDFAEASGIINPETRPLWENADYVPFYRVEDDRLVGPLSGGAGIANQRSPIRTLKGGESNVGDIMHNIMVNLTRLIDSSVKNQAALMAVDALRQSGIIAREPMEFSNQLIPLEQVKKLLIDKGINPASIPADALVGFQKMFAIQAPKGDGIISVMRDGKKEFYYTDDPILFRAMTSINKKAWGAWMNLLRGPKRLLTAWVTLDPGFMIANYVRDAAGAFVLSRDNIIPLVSGAKGFAQAMIKDDAMRTLLSSGSAFESGYINQYDPEATRRLLRKELTNKTFAQTVLDSPLKLYEAWKALGSGMENANRLAVYNAALSAGKGKRQAAYEAKDLMDFSMGGDWPMVQFLIQTVPFMGARLQGLHRLGRGFRENPLAFSFKGALVGIAGLALWFAYRDDERYKRLEDWDKDTYYHFWVGDQHFRLPKPFEIGAIFNTIPERAFEYMYSKENDAGKLMMKRWGFMLAETFNMNPIPQVARPMVEGWFNRNFFTGNQIVSPYEEQRLPPERFRYYTSPTMIELAKSLPAPLDAVSEKIRNPLQLQNMYAGYTGTLGRYLLMGSDALVRHFNEIPEPPARMLADYPVIGRFARGDEPRRERYEEEFYNLLRKTLQVQGSVKFLQKATDDERADYIEGKYEPYIAVAKELEGYRTQIQKLNEEIRNVYMDRSLSPQEKRAEVDMLQSEKNDLFKEAYELRPGGSENPMPENVTSEQIKFLIDKFNVNSPTPEKTLVRAAPVTASLVVDVATLDKGQLESISRAGARR